MDRVRGASARAFATVREGSRASTCVPEALLASLGVVSGRVTSFRVLFGSSSRALSCFLFSCHVLFSRVMSCVVMSYNIALEGGVKGKKEERGEERREEMRESLQPRSYKTAEISRRHWKADLRPIHREKKPGKR